MLKIDLPAQSFLGKWVRNKVNLSILGVQDNSGKEGTQLLKPLENRKLIFVPLVPDPKTSKLVSLVKKQKTIQATTGKPDPLGKTFDTLDSIAKLFPSTSVFEVLIFIESFDETTDAPTYEYKATLMLKKVDQ